MAASFEDFLKEYEQETRNRWAQSRITVMVLGPDVTKDEDGARLRKFIVDKAGQNETTVTGEHRGLAKIHQNTLGAGRNLCSMELQVALRVDALVMVPDSAGSLVELGLFALQEDICRKTLVLFCKAYQNNNNPTFIDLGPKAAYDQKGGRTEFVVYSDTEGVWAMVDEFLMSFRANKYEKRLLQGN